MTKKIKKFDEARIEKAVREILSAVGEDLNRDGLKNTPARVARMYSELLAGMSENPDAHLARTLTLVAGTNTIRAYAVDLGANLSTTNTVSFVSSNTFTLQLGFAAGPPLSGNGLSFDLQISPGLNGRIEASTNLATWVTLTNFIGTNAIIHIRDTAATNLNQRFYRAVTP